MSHADSQRVHPYRAAAAATSGPTYMSINLTAGDGRESSPALPPPKSPGRDCGHKKQHCNGDADSWSSAAVFWDRERRGHLRKGGSASQELPVTGPVAAICSLHPIPHGWHLPHGMRRARVPRLWWRTRQT